MFLGCPCRRWSLLQYPCLTAKALPTLRGAVLCCTALLQGLVLDVKGILGARTDVPALLAQMITPPEPAALLQGVQWLCWTAALLDCFVAVHN